MRSLRYTTTMVSRSRGAAVLRSLAAAVAAALTFFVFAQSATVRDQASQLSVGGIDPSLVERATICLTLVAVAVGALQIGVLMTRIVLQRMQEIGVLKAAGVSDRSIFAVFAYEAVLYGFLGGVLGCLVGLGISLFGPMPGTGQAIRAAAVTIGVSTLVSAVAGIGPALRAIRAPAVEALSHTW